ncbi:glycosyltransferase family 4 protein [Nisaea acidiphila]|uniref:Glycosyltransferase family 4 protein n=1 Tax=Nisaea acidiphila TaxID=1862145 RepID=A0A9J7AQP2_9PROT|nr:glycosyltransferase family 4 protein [Nisaea acidiphila]UUX49202.1 glycosyltransferase family 4 protein [Nisaea acidiphila]
MRQARLQQPDAPVHFILPGPIGTLTGGFIYDREMADGLREAGRLGAVHELAGDFPRAAPYDVAAGAAILSGLPDRALCVIDGLALSALGQAVAQHAPRLDVVAMIHHPLADETGLSTREQEAFFQAEKAVLGEVARIVVSSAQTARRLREFGVNPSAVHVVEPGISGWARNGNWSGGTERPLRVLSVGTLTLRKGHDIALTALAECRNLDWTLDLVGAARDAAHTSALKRLAAELGLEERVTFHGERDEAALAELHQSAGLFLSASHHEGFGMALADAVAFGLPVVTTEEAAVSDAVREAAELVPAGEKEALAHVLRAHLESDKSRFDLAARSRRAAPRLSDWTRARAAFQRAVDGVTLQ